VTKHHSDIAGAGDSDEANPDEVETEANNAAREQKLARLHQLFRRSLQQAQQSEQPQPLFDCLVRYRLDQP
jgi:hypothetical protein